MFSFPRTSSSPHLVSGRLVEYFALGGIAGEGGFCQHHHQGHRRHHLGQEFEGYSFCLTALEG
ncbi:hypothetical protein M758_1G109000 [Ceratodon purpureus]|nr:hypothetical protein M758_1G109000 [Ceratodon purpureus]